MEEIPRHRKLSTGELDRLSPDEFRSVQKRPVIIVLDNIRSLHNVGAAFRTADAFRIEGIMICGVTGKPPDREIEKTALGATSTVTWRYFDKTKDALSALRDENYRVFAVEQAERSVLLMNFRSEPGEKIALVFGNEVYGVEQEVIDLCDGCIEIPQSGSKHSLNVSVAMGIVLWELVRNN